MKFLLLFCFAFILSLESFAQRDPDKLFYAQKVEKYRRMKSIGTTLTVTGAILFVVGISSMVDVMNSTSSNTSQSTLNSKAETAYIACLIGEAGLGAGIPLWIVGGHAQRKYERKFEKVMLGFNLSPKKTGLTLTLRF